MAQAPPEVKAKAQEAVQAAASATTAEDVKAAADKIFAALQSLNTAQVEKKNKEEGFLFRKHGGVPVWGWGLIGTLLAGGIFLMYRAVK